MPQPPREEVERDVISLPLVEDGGPSRLINEKGSQNAIVDLEKHDSDIPKHARMQVLAIVQEVAPDLRTTEDGRGYEISRDQLEDIVRKGVLRGAMQTVIDIGHVMHEVHELEAQLDQPIVGILPPEETI